MAQTTVGSLRALLRSLRECGYPSVDAGPLLGSQAGGPYVSISGLEGALELIAAMTVVLVQDGSDLSVRSVDGETIATVPLS